MATNVNSPNGFIVVDRKGGGNVKYETYICPSTDSNGAFGVGDPVVVPSNGSGTNYDSVTGIPYITLGGTTGALDGVCAGCQNLVGANPNTVTFTAFYRANSTYCAITVCDDPLAVYEVQEDGSATFNAYYVRKGYFGTNYGTLNTTTACSNASINTSTYATSLGSLQWYILSAEINGQLGLIGTQYARYRVVLANRTTTY